MSNVTIAPLSDTSVDESNVSFKAISGQIGVDKAQGIVECFVSGVGNKDSVGDIVLPGAFNASLKRRKPRVVWGHDWNQPIGKVLEIYEVPSSDSRLPEKMKKAGVGGLFAKVQFNLNTERGREAFANVAFYGNEQEWSIGYKTITADFDAGSQANMLKEVELYEISPVLHGANQLTGTISVKNEQRGVVKEQLPNEEKGGLSSTQMADPNNPKAVLRTALSQALNKPVEIMDMDENSVIFESSPGMVWRAEVRREGNRYMVGAPTRVKPVTKYMSMDEDSLPKGSGYQLNEDETEDAMKPMGVKEEGMHGMLLRDGSVEVGKVEEPEGFSTESTALSWSMTLMCEGVHSHNGRFFPCKDRETYMSALKMFDGNANINAQNSYEADVSEDESVKKKDAEPCSCGTEVKGGEMPYTGYDDDEKGGGRRYGISPSVQRDPMALLLMAYNAMLPLQGAKKEREALLGMIDMLEDFMTGKMQQEVEVVMATPKSVSGYVVNVKCQGDQKFEVIDQMRRIPVYASQTAEGVNLHFSTKANHDDLLKRVARRISRLSFEPEVSGKFQEQVDTNSGVK